MTAPDAPKRGSEFIPILGIMAYLRALSTPNKSGPSTALQRRLTSGAACREQLHEASPPLQLAELHAVVPGGRVQSIEVMCLSLERHSSAFWPDMRKQQAGGPGMDERREAGKILVQLFRRHVLQHPLRANPARLSCRHACQAFFADDLEGRALGFNDVRRRAGPAPRRECADRCRAR